MIDTKKDLPLSFDHPELTLWPKCAELRKATFQKNLNEIMGLPLWRRYSEVNNSSVGLPLWHRCRKHPFP